MWRGKKMPIKELINAFLQYERRFLREHLKDANDEGCLTSIGRDTERVDPLLVTSTKEVVFPTMSVCLFGLSAGLHKNYWTDFHKSWMVDGSWLRTDPVNFCCCTRTSFFHCRDEMRGSWSGIFRWLICERVSEWEQFDVDSRSDDLR